MVMRAVRMAFVRRTALAVCLSVSERKMMRMPHFIWQDGVWLFAGCRLVAVVYEYPVKRSAVYMS